MSENAATRALEIVLRRDWNRTFETNDPYARAFEQQRVKNAIRKFPKTSARIASVVKNVSANESTIAALKKAVDARDIAAIRKLYRPEFFFEVLRRNRAANADVMNAVLPATMRRSRSPEAVLRRLLDVGTEIFPAMPAAVARIATIHKIPVEKLVRMAVSGTSSSDLLAIFKTLEKNSKLDFSKVGESDMFLLFVNRHDEYIDSAENSPPMDVLILLKFMNKRGAPLVPLEDVMRYVVDYESEIGGNRENRPEFDALLRLYDD